MLDEQSKDHKFIEELISILDANLNDENFGVSELAREISLSRSQLHRRLRVLCKKSTSLFIREHRLHSAMEMLQGNVATAAEIAYRVGFSSPNYFNSSFKKLYGYPPGEVKFRSPKKDSEVLQKSEAPELQKDSRPSIKGSQKRILLFSSIALVLVLSSSYFIYEASSKSNTPNVTITKNTEKSIAVLPFKNFSGDASMDPFCDGMTDEVIARLTTVESISKVISRTSVFQYKETEKRIPEIASELGVIYVLEGNFQKSGDKIKVRVQLINGLTDDHFWSDDYSGVWSSANIFKIQAEVAENVAKHIDADISEEESLGINKIPTNNNEAYTNFLLAQSQKYKANESSLKNAIPYYEKAIALDSNYIEAYVGLADIWLTGGLVWGIFDEQEAWDNVKKLLTKVQEIDSGFGDIEDTLYACYFYYDFDFVKVDGYYQKRLDNFRFNKTPAIDADFAIKTGRLNETIISMDKHIVIDPSIGNFCSFKAEALMLLGKTDDAKSLMRRCDPLYSDDWFYLRESAKLHYYLGNYTKSREQLKKLTTNFSDYPPLLIWLQLVYAQMDGNNAEVKKYLGLLTEEYQKGSSGSPAWFIALYHCSLSNYEEAFKWLEISYDQHEVELTWLREEPLLQPLKNDPRYMELYDKIGFLAFDRHLAEK